MTRKHFEAIARSFHRAMESTVHVKTQETLFELASDVAFELEGFNSSFDRKRFLAACGFAVAS